MADIDIASLRLVHSGVIAAAEDKYSRVYNILDDNSGKADSFSRIFNKAVDNINTTNAYLSDAENEEIRWALGETDNTHDLAIALQKAQVALQYTVAVRDRAVQAYQEIMQMQI
ncbi:MAG: flagellar hook-basal body complex protein FliE [Butyrivibrio sp.]|nr:flagellar hook-basal body complex protein FliE [Butyrivibrio sp.]